jgi:ATP-binding cassette, subfamily B, bacterial PglK
VFLLGPDVGKVPVMILLFLTSSMLDLVGISLIGPYVGLLLDQRGLDDTLLLVIKWFNISIEQQQLVEFLGFCLIFIFMIKAIFAIGINYMIVRFSQSQEVRLSSFLMSSFQAMNYKDYICRNTSEYIYSIIQLTSHFSGLLVTLLRGISELLVGLVILGLLAWSNFAALAFLIGMMGLLILIYDLSFRRKLNDYGLIINKTRTLILQSINEAFEGFKEIRVLGQEKYFYKTLHKGIHNVARLAVKQNVINTTPRYILEFIIIFFIVILISVMLNFDKNIQAIIPTLSIFAFASLRLLPTANMLSGNLLQIRFSRDSISRLYGDLKHLQLQSPRTEVKNKNSTSILSPDELNENSNIVFKSLELKNLSFCYPNVKQKVLESVSLKIRVGESIGIIGPSGAGKTTLIDMLLGLLEPLNGDILYNKKPLNQMLQFWRSQVSYLPQEVFLIDNSLRSNIALGVEENLIDEVKLHQALKQARLLEMVEEMPNGAETQLGERGVKLSGGQRQRVAIARAFYHGRKVLVMDESTSSLDLKTEQEIVKEINQLKGTITLIVIAHRFTTVQQCDRIYHLVKGKINEVGTAERMLSSHK